MQGPKLIEHRLQSLVYFEQLNMKNLSDPNKYFLRSKDLYLPTDASKKQRHKQRPRFVQNAHKCKLVFPAYDNRQDYETQLEQLLCHVENIKSSLAKLERQIEKLASVPRRPIVTRCREFRLVQVSTYEQKMNTFENDYEALFYRSRLPLLMKKDKFFARYSEDQASQIIFINQDRGT